MRDYISAKERVSVDYKRSLFERCKLFLTQKPVEYYEERWRKEKKQNAMIINLGLQNEHVSSGAF